MLETIKQYKNIIIIVITIIIMVATYFFGYNNGYNKGKSESLVLHETKEVKIPAEVKTETQTVIKQIEKETDSAGIKEKTDVEANIGKPEINVKVNGKTQTIKKEENEKYVFDKNKLTLDQTSKASLDIKVPVIDNTRKWSAGIGYGNHGLAGKIDFPLKKPVGGWVYADKKTIAGGIQINF